MRARTAFGRLAGRTMVWTVVAAFVSSGVALRPTPGVLAADPQVEGRKHSRKAAQLAAADKCRAAIVEYNKALALLKDPVLLFNRGECYRRLKDNDRALADYRKFLQEVPDAPNRAQVAARIAQLDPASAQAEAAAPTPPAPAAPAPAPAAPAVAAAPSLPAPDRAVLEPTPEAAMPAATSIDTSPSQQFGDPEIVMVDSPPQGDRASGSATGQWWFWTAIGAVLVGGGIATYFILNPGKTEVPPTRLGNYPF